MPSFITVWTVKYTLYNVPRMYRQIRINIWTFIMDINDLKTNVKSCHKLK